MLHTSVDGFRLSLQQARLWALQPHEQPSPYRTQGQIRISGPLDRARLAAACAAIIMREEVLRTTYRCVRGLMLPLQVIGDTQLDWLADQDLSDLSAAAQATQIEALLHAARQRPLDLRRGPIGELRLLRCAPEQHVLLVTLSACSADSTTLALFTQLLGRAYNATPAGALPEPTLQYADFADWQHEMRSSEDAPDSSGWSQLAPVPLHSARLPFDTAEPGSTPFQPKALPVALSPVLVARLCALCAEHATSRATFLLACWQILLWRLTGEAEMLLGFAGTGRMYEEVEDAFGPFATYVPLHMQLKAGAHLDELLQHVAATSQRTTEAQESFTWDAFGDLLQISKEAAFFPWCFMFVELTDAQADGPVSFALTQLESITERFKVQLTVTQAADRLALVLHYDASVCSAQDMARLAEQLHTLLESVVARPEVPLREFVVVGPHERQHVLVELNDTCSPYPEETCLHQLFEAQALRTPNAVAVSDGVQRRTYAELDTHANRLAHYLRACGVGPEARVAICLKRSVDLLVGLLGILKAGAAYVPLDLAHPPASLQFILEDSGVQVLVTERESAIALADLIQHAQSTVRHLVQLDADWPAIAHHEATPPDSGVVADNLAYMIYTSGSTGRPKGTLIPHRAVGNYLTWCSAAYDVAAGDGALVHSSLAFDLTITGLFAPLLVGRTVHLAADNQGVEALGTALQQMRDLSVLKMTPAHLDLLAQQIPASEAGGRARAFIIGGENLLTQRLAFWRAAAPETMLVNEYGPTETVVGCCAYCLPPAGEFAGAVPIGRPINNTQLYILDERMQPVPFGWVGELYIGGAGLARGYHNRPDLTAERFVPNPFVDERRKTKDEGHDSSFILRPSSRDRLYKTGDLARYRADGNLEFIGRCDDQVKIRGYRVEPGEIAAALERHPGVQQAIVLARADNGGALQLVGFVVSAGAVPADATTLRRYLQAQLPEYMVPTAWIYLDRLPLTSNGKVDRAALRALDALPTRTVDAVAPRTSMERTLADIWEQVLRVETVGIHDDFFDIGGDSILCFQLIARARRAGLQLTIKQCFEERTIANLAAALDGTAETVNAEQGPVSGPLPLTPIQHWFLEQGLVEPQHYNQAVLVTIPSSLDIALLEQAVMHLQAYHDALRLRFRRSAAGWEQVNADLHGASSFTRIDLRAATGDEYSRIVTARAAEFQASLDLEQGPLAQLVFFEPGPDQPGRMLFVIHHLAVDSVSWRILLEDLQTIYQQLSCGAAPQLPPKTTSFRQWAQHLSAYAQTPAVQQELEYWRASLPPAVPALPRDHATAAALHTEATAQLVIERLTIAETRMLLQDIQKRQQFQVSEALLAALYQSIASWSGAETVLVDLEGHGREDVLAGVDLSRTVGWFTTIYPLALHAPADVDLADLLGAVKMQMRRVPQHGLGYGLLRYLSADPSAKASLAALPQPEICFNYLGQLDLLPDEPALLMPAPEAVGPLRSPQAPRRYLFEIIATIAAGQLEVIWHYSEQLHERATIKRLAQRFTTTLRAIIALPPAEAPTMVEAPAAIPPPSADQSLLIQLQEGDAGPPFFCVHPSGGLVFVYSDLARQLGVDQPFYAIQPVGLDPAQPMDTVVEIMAARYVRALQSIQPEGPYAVGGWSGGAIIAFEMAQQLQAMGAEVAVLALFDQGTPDPNGWRLDDATLLASVFGQEAEPVLTHLREFAPDDQLAYVLRRAQDARILPSEMGLAEIRHFLTIYKTTNAALGAYIARPYAGRITLFRATHQPAGPKQNDPTLGWGAIAPGRLDVYDIPGDHYSIMHIPDLMPVVAQLKACLSPLMLSISAG